MKGIEKTIPNTNDIIIPEINVMMVTDQKLEAAPEKNLVPDFSFSLLLRIEKRPPVRNELTMKAKKTSRKNPVVKAEKMFAKGRSRSVITSTLIVSCKSSVIMLEPSMLLKPERTGIATRLIIRNVINQLITMPFHDFSEERAPVPRLYNIFIFNWIKVK
jgi:hypothetical protein